MVVSKPHLLELRRLLVLADRSLCADGLRVTKPRLAAAASASRSARRHGDVSITDQVGLAALLVRPRATCLRRALVVEALLVEQGVAANAAIGVRRARTGGWESHAWVEIEGRPVSDSTERLDRFHRLDLPTTLALQAP